MITDYIPTQKEIIEFNRDRMGYTYSVSIDSKPLKELNGQLVLIEGNNITVISYDKPWALLQSIKNKYNYIERKKLFLKSLQWKKK